MRVFFEIEVFRWRTFRSWIFYLQGIVSFWIIFAIEHSEIMYYMFTSSSAMRELLLCSPDRDPSFASEFVLLFIYIFQLKFNNLEISLWFMAVLKFRNTIQYLSLQFRVSLWFLLWFYPQRLLLLACHITYCFSRQRFYILLKTPGMVVGIMFLITACY